jgi:D-arabinose 1-dehydrogenase-like Zn-dependent alcohol dehydrogenase
MRAAVLREYGEPLDITDVERPSAADHGVVVDVETCGICRSDWHGWQGDYQGMDLIGQVMGHEPAGTVIEVGDGVEYVREGDEVVVPFRIADGTCPRCRNGHTHVCENGPSLGFDPSVPGAFGEEIHAPWADVNVSLLPDGVSTVEMAGLGCRFMTSFHALAHRADVSAADWVAVHGCGGIGLSAVDVATALGGNVVAVDLDDEKLDLARDFGAEETINAREVGDVPKEVRDVTDGGADISVDALGIAETCRNSVASLAHFGQHVQIGLTTKEEGGYVSLPTDEMIRKELEFIGSYGMQPTRYDEIFRMVERDRIHPADLVSRRVSLDDLNDRLEAMTDFETKGIEVITEY